MIARLVRWLRSLRRPPTPEELEAELVSKRLVDEKLTARSHARHHRR